MNSAHWKPRTGISLSLALCAATLASSVLPGQEAPSPSSPDRRALVVGVGDYPAVSGWSRLEGAPRDAERMAAVLTARFGFAADDVKLLIDGQATRDAILEAFRSHLIEPAGPDTIAVFYFAGHGSQVWDQDGDEGEGPSGMDETLCPVDSVAAGRGERRDILDDEVEALISELNQKAGQVVGLFDSCHSGSAMRSSDVTRVVRAAPAAPRPDQSGPRERTDGGARERSLLGREDWPGRTQPVFLLACRGDQQASENTPDLALPRRGEFSRALESALVRCRPGDTWRSVYDQVLAHLYRRRLSQDPVLQGDSSRAVFGDGYRALPDQFAILEATGAGTLRVAAGILEGVEVGARLALRPESDGEPLGAKVIASELHDCEVLVDAGLGPGLLRKVAGNYRAEVQEGPPPRFQLRVELSPSLAAEQLAALEEWRTRTRYFTAPDESGADLHLAFDAARGFVVVDSSGEQILPHPFRPSRTVDDVQHDLENYAVYAATWAIQNPESPLAAGIEMKWVLGYTNEEKTRDNRPEFLPGDEQWQIGPGGEPIADMKRFREAGRWPAMYLTVENRSRSTLYMGAYGLLPSLGLQPMLATPEALPPAGKPYRTEVYLNSNGWPDNPDRLEGLPPERYKFLFTTEPRSYLNHTTGIQEDPGATSAPERDQNRSSGDNSRTSLDQLLALSYSGGDLRSSGPPRGPMHWTTKEYAIRIIPDPDAPSEQDREESPE